MPSIDRAQLALRVFPARRTRQALRRRPTTALRLEVCEPRRVLSGVTNDDFFNVAPAWSPDGSMLVFQSDHLDPDPDDDIDITTIHVIDISTGDIVTLGEGRTPVWAASDDDHDHDHDHDHEGDVLGSVVDGRLVSNHRGYGYDFELDTTMFDVGFDVADLPAGTELQLEVLQGVTFWNGRGNAPTFTPVRQGVELNFNNDAENVRVGARSNVGRLLDIGAAEATEGGTEVHEHFDVTAGIGGTGDAFRRPAPSGIYVVMGRLVADGANPSAPMAFVFNVNASEEAHDAAVEFFDEAPPVSVFGVDMPAETNYGLGSVLQVAYRFSDPVAATGSPRLPLTIGGKRRFAMLDRAASSGENLVFAYTMRAGDRGAVRPRGSALGIQLPKRSQINGVAGGTVFRTFAITWPDVRALTSRPKVTRVQSQTVQGTFDAGAVLEFGLTWNQAVHVEGATMPSLVVRAIRGSALGNAEWVDAGGGPATEHVFRYTIKAADAAPRGIRIVSPISLNGSAITDGVGNPSVLKFASLRLPRVRVVTP